MATVTVLPELLAMGRTFCVAGELMVHIEEPPGEPSKIDIQLEAPSNGEWDFLHQWAEEDPEALEEWTCQLVRSLNRMAAEGLERVSVMVPLREAQAPG